MSDLTVEESPPSSAEDGPRRKSVTFKVPVISSRSWDEGIGYHFTGEAEDYEESNTVES